MYKFQTTKGKNRLRKKIPPKKEKKLWKETDQNKQKVQNSMIGKN